LIIIICEFFLVVKFLISGSIDFKRMEMGKISN